DPRAGIAYLLKYLVTVSDFSAWHYFDASVACLHQRRDLLANSVFVWSIVNSIEHVRRCDYGFNSIRGGGPAHSHRFFKRYRAIIELWQHVAVNINHLCQIERYC